MEKIALGFANTVDYEVEWDNRHLEELIQREGVRRKDIQKKTKIKNLKDLLVSVLYHMQEGSGCGMITENPGIIEDFLEGVSYRAALGGTNMRAAEVISVLGGTGLIHLVSVNDETVKRMPSGMRWIGGEEFPCCFPHIAIQFPKGSQVNGNDISITAPRANRVIYSGDAACAKMPLNEVFFKEAAESQVLLLSSFDLITDFDLMDIRLKQVGKFLEGYGTGGPLIFYEHAHFADERLSDMVREQLIRYMDIYSMNEDEFQTLAGGRINLLDENAVWEGLLKVRKKLPGVTILVHTCYWGLVFGEKAKVFVRALEYGMLTATTRYRQGWVDGPSIEKTRHLKKQSEALRFSQKLQQFSPCFLRCLATAEAETKKTTTVGLGDSFVGGFLYEFCYKELV